MNEEIKKEFFKKVRFKKVKLEEIASRNFNSYDIFEDSNLKSYVIKGVFDEENKLEVAEYPEKNGVPNVFTIDLNFEEEQKKVIKLLRFINPEHKDLVEKYFEECKYSLADIIKSRSENYNIFEIIIKNDKYGKGVWIVNSINSEENSLQVIKFPFEKGSDLAIGKAELNEKTHIEKIDKIYR